MAWYRAGTVTVANGSPTVTGAGTDFVANAQIGHAFLGPDGKVYEIAQVEAAGQVVLSAPYLGGSGAGQGYAIMPTSSFARDLALGAAQLLNTFATVRDTVGQGLFADGSLAAPGLRFTADQDTGIRRSDANVLALVAGGEDYFRAGLGALYAHKPFVPAAPGLPSLVAYRNDPSSPGLRLASNFAGGNTIDINTGINGVSNGGLDIRLDDVSRLVIDAAGNLLVGVTSGTRHRIARGGTDGTPVLDVVQSCSFFAGSNTGFSQSNAGLWLVASGSTGRSLNAAGTINASGADYAEYMTKAAGCGTIAKGDVCGVNIDGHLTKTWADARSFVVKSTDPSYVGGDTWGQSVGPRPESPGEEPTPPIAPPAAPVSEDDADVAAWQAAVSAYPAHIAAYQSTHAVWTTAKAAYDTALPAWEAALEAERQKVDRIAFAGQVPVNVAGDFAVGDYLIATASGAGIKAVAVPADTITFDQYRRRLGKVWAVRDGRAWVDVQHG